MNLYPATPPQVNATGGFGGEVSPPAGLVRPRSSIGSTELELGLLRQKNADLQLVICNQFERASELRKLLRRCEQMLVTGSKGFPSSELVTLIKDIQNLIP